MVKDRFDKIKSDYFQKFPILMSFLMVLVNWWQYYNTNELSSFIRMICWCIQIPMIFFFGRIATFIWLVIYSQLLVFVNGDYQNFTAFFFIIICCVLQPKHEKLLLFLYVFNTCIIAQIHHVEVSKLVYHILLCWGLRIGVKFSISPKFQRQKLDLAIDEENILNQLAQGICQNAVEGYSVSTVSRKIKKAMERNSIANIDDLIRAYKLQKEPCK